MLVSWVVFAGAVMTASPLTMLFYLPAGAGLHPLGVVLAGGLLATVLSTRSTLVLAAALMLASPLLLLSPDSASRFTLPR